MRCHIAFIPAIVFSLGSTCLAEPILVFTYSGPCNSSGQEGYATPLVYVKNKQIVEAPEGFVQKSENGALIPIPEFHRGKKYYLYSSDGRHTGFVRFLETVVTDRSYGAVDQSKVVTELFKEDKNCVWDAGIVTDFPLSAVQESVTRVNVLQLKNMALKYSKDYLEKRTKNAKIKRELLKAIAVRHFGLSKNLPIVVADARYIEETQERRRGAGFVAVWSILKERWNLIFDSFADEPDYIGIGGPTPSFGGIADLDSDGIAEVIGHDVGCDTVYKYIGKRLKLFASSCNGYITE